MPRSYKLDLFRTKKVLKDAFKDDLPDFLFNQPKRGWFHRGLSGCEIRISRSLPKRRYLKITTKALNSLQLAQCGGNAGKTYKQGDII